MKKKSFFKTFIALFITVNVMAQNVPNYVPTNGLVGWWPFNGNANDESGNGYNAKVVGANLSKDRNGNDNKAFNFETSILSNISISFSKDIEDTFSISFWAMPNKEINVVNETNNCNNSFSVELIDGQNWALFPGNGLDNALGVGVSIGTNALQIGEHGNNVLTSRMSNTRDYAKFNHIVLVYKLDSAYLYIDGVKLISKKLSCLTTQKRLITPIYFGSKYPDKENFSGKIDDISIFNRPLTQEEITALYTSTPPCTTPTATITPQSNTTFCQGGFVNLNASTGANYTYEWYNNGQLINGATASVYQATVSGNYTVKVIDGACDATSTATTITVNPNPTATITPQGNTTFCQGGFVNLVASGGTSYQWNTGSSAATISATQSGTYTVNVFNSFGCQATASQQVTVNPLPNVTLNALNQFTLKNASPIQLVANPTGGTFSGDGVQGTAFNPANVTLGKKTITYNYTSPEGCSGTASRSTFVVDSIGNVCNVTNYDTVKVTKTIYDTVIVNKTIYDTVKVTKTINDTVSILKVKFKLTTGIKANQYTSMNVYPNPTSDVIVIEASDVAALNGYSYKLFDVQGKEVYNALVTNAKTEISMKTFGKAGVYILHVVDANNVSIETKQIVLE